MTLAQITDALVQALSGLTFGPPVTHVYNPLLYARSRWDAYCERYGAAPREIVLVGMNPGPWGMSQTGVPFGEVGFARDWLGLEGPVGRPEPEHPARPVQGFECRRSEVSGQRLWGWARDRYGTPEAFFARFFIANYCPLVFLEASGRNRTPDKLPAAEQTPLLAACDEALRATIELMAPRQVVGIGAWAEARARTALRGRPGLGFGRIPHPSPASPAANRDWPGQVDAALAALLGEEAGRFPGDGVFVSRTDAEKRP